MTEQCTVCKRKLSVPLPKCKQCGDGPICNACDDGCYCSMQSGPCGHWFCCSCLYSRYEACSKRAKPENRFLVVQPLCQECDGPPHAFYYGNGPVVFAHRRFGDVAQRRRYQRTIANTCTFLMCCLAELVSDDRSRTLAVELVRLCSEYTRPTGTLCEVVAANMNPSHYWSPRSFRSRMLFVMRDDGFVSGVVSLRVGPMDRTRDIAHHRHHARLLCEKNNRVCAGSTVPECDWLALVKYMLDGCHATYADTLYLYQDNIGVAQLHIIDGQSYELTIYMGAPTKVPRLLEGLIATATWDSIMCKKTHVTYKTCISEHIRRACPVCSPDT